MSADVIAKLNDLIEDYVTLKIDEIHFGDVEALIKKIKTDGFHIVEVPAKIRWINNNFPELSAFPFMMELRRLESMKKNALLKHKFHVYDNLEELQKEMAYRFLRKTICRSFLFGKYEKTLYWVPSGEGLFRSVLQEILFSPT